MTFFFEGYFFPFQLQRSVVFIFIIKLLFDQFHSNESAKLHCNRSDNYLKRVKENNKFL